MQTTAEAVAGPWKVKGLLHATGVHAGAVEYAYSKGDSSFKSAKDAGIPASGPVSEQIEKAKAKVRGVLKARFAKAGAPKEKEAKSKAMKSKVPHDLRP